MTFEVNGKPDLSVVIRLAPDEAEYWVFKDVSAFKGKTIKITYDGNEKGLSKIYQSDEIEGQAELYKEKNRPQFHFTTRCSSGRIGTSVPWHGSGKYRNQTLSLTSPL